MKKNDSKKEVLEAGGIKLDENQHTVFMGSKQLFLTVKEFDLLLLLIKNRGNVLTRDYLLETIWELSTEIESRTVDVHIRTLRQKLGDDGKEELNYIDIVRKIERAGDCIYEISKNCNF